MHKYLIILAAGPHHLNTHTLLAGKQGQTIFVIACVVLILLLLSRLFETN